MPQSPNLAQSGTAWRLCGGAINDTLGFDDEILCNNSSWNFKQNETISNTFESIVMYPNPACESVVVRSTGELINTIRVFDSLGKEVLRKNCAVKQFILDTSTLSNGNYIVDIITDTNNKKIKLQIQKP